MPAVVLIPKRAAVFPALEKSPCKTLFDKVSKERKLSTTFPVPFLIGAGSALYPFATG